MASWFKMGLWVVAVLAPGGFLLLPVLLAPHKLRAARQPDSTPVCLPMTERS